MRLVRLCFFFCFISRIWRPHRLCGVHTPQSDRALRGARPVPRPPRLVKVGVGLICTERSRYRTVAAGARTERYPKSTARGPVLANHSSCPTQRPHLLQSANPKALFVPGVTPHAASRYFRAICALSALDSGPTRHRLRRSVSTGVVLGATRGSRVWPTCGRPFVPSA